MLVAKRCRVTGRVQGVFYRASTREQACKLNLAGYAKNLADGCVEVLAVGEPAQVEALAQWLWQGSPASHVMRVDVTELQLSELTDVPTEFVTA